MFTLSAHRRAVVVDAAVLLLTGLFIFVSEAAGQTGKAAGYAEAERAVTKLEQ